MFGVQGWRTHLDRLRESFAALERRVEKLETSAPAVTAALNDASDRLARNSARLERAHRRAAPAEAPLDDDEQELEDLWNEVHKRA